MHKARKEYREKFGPALKKKKKIFYQKNREAIRAKQKEYSKDSRPKLREYRRKYYLLKKDDPAFFLIERLRGRVRACVKNRKFSVSEYTACSGADLRKHLETLFTPGMTWESYGYRGWHIDHIVPLSLFDLSDPVEQKKACHYTNLQPLWAEDNMRKGNSLIRG